MCKKRKLQYVFTLMLFLLLASPMVYAQELKHKPRKSPTGLATYKKDDLYIKVTYGRPSIEDEEQKVFGNIVPWRRVWRTGADDATEITLTDTVDILGTTVMPGIYSLFTIPDTAEWNVILNNEVGMWGIYKYNPEKNLIDTKVPLYKSPKSFLIFSIFIDEIENGVDLVLVWRFSVIRIPIRRTEE